MHKNMQIVSWDLALFNVQLSEFLQACILSFYSSNECMIRHFFLSAYSLIHIRNSTCRKRIMSFASPQEVLNFWFAEDMSMFNDERFVNNKMKQWYTSATDEEVQIQHANKDLVDRAGSRQLTDDIWLSRDGILAQIILLDQFTREIYRGTAKAFQYDTVAEALTWQVIEGNQLMSYHPMHRTFILSPLLHAENLRSQQKGVELVPTIAHDAPEGLRNYMAMLPQFYHDHYDVIRRFGRFPSRNAVLVRVLLVLYSLKVYQGRQNTPEEDIYLLSPDLPAWAKSQLPRKTEEKM